MKLPKKTKCNSEFGNYTRHKWLSNGECDRCRTKRNPAAGTKMFRFSTHAPRCIARIPRQVQRRFKWSLRQMREYLKTVPKELGGLK